MCCVSARASPPQGGSLAAALRGLRAVADSHQQHMQLKGFLVLGIHACSSPQDACSYLSTGSIQPLDMSHSPYERQSGHENRGDKSENLEGSGPNEYLKFAPQLLILGIERVLVSGVQQCIRQQGLRNRDLRDSRTEKPVVMAR